MRGWAMLWASHGMPTVIVSLCTSPDPEEKLKGLVYGSVVSEGDEERRENHEGGKLDPLGHGTRYDRGGCRAG